MKKQFDIVLESFFPTTMKFVTKVRYPKQIQFSDDFLKSLKAEFNRLQTIEEVQNISAKSYKERFLKAVNFCINAF